MAPLQESQTPGVKDLMQEDIAHIKNESDVLFANHPRERHEGSTKLPSWFPKDDDKHSISIKVLCGLSLGEAGAQVALCSVKSSSKQMRKALGYKKAPKKVVAKIFDPMHYYRNPDMVAEADPEYAQEAAAYILLHDEKRRYQDKPHLVPNLHGTWTTNVTKDHLRKAFTDSKSKKDQDPPIIKIEDNRLAIQSFRPVRFVLMEWIEGSDLSEITEQPDEYNNFVRFFPEFWKFEDIKEHKKVFRDILDSVSSIINLGITHNKTIPASSMIRDKDHSIVVTDFAQVIVASDTDIGHTLLQKFSKPLHPVHGTIISNYLAFAAWFPD